MKNYFLIILISLIPFFTQAQTSDSTGRFGFTVNPGMNTELSPIRIVPGITYFKGNSQLELGFGIHPFIQKDQKILSTELNYKYYPNGVENKFNMYLIAHFSYAHNSRDTYYPTTYNYLFLNGGYGFEINASKDVYLGTNVNIGTHTFSKKNESPANMLISSDLFDEFGVNFGAQVNIGYRF